MKKTTIYVLAKNSVLWETGCDYAFDLIIEKVVHWFNDVLIQHGWVDLNAVLPSLGLPKEIDKVALGWKLNYSLYFKDCCIDIGIVVKDDDKYLAFHNVVNLLEDGESNEN